MEDKRKKIITGVLLGAVIFLMVAIFYISFILTKGAREPTASVAPKKVKASNVSYTKLIAFNQTPPTATPALTATVSPKSSPTPTEILLAKGGSPTPASGSSVTKPATISATTIKSLPVTGVITNSLIVAAVAGLLVFFSFIF